MPLQMHAVIKAKSAPTKYYSVQLFWPAVFIFSINLLVTDFRQPSRKASELITRLVCEVKVTRYIKTKYDIRPTTDCHINLRHVKPRHCIIPLFLRGLVDRSKIKCELLKYFCYRDGMKHRFYGLMFIYRCPFQVTIIRKELAMSYIFTVSCLYNLMFSVMQK